MQVRTLHRFYFFISLDKFDNLKCFLKVNNSDVKFLKPRLERLRSATCTSTCTCTILTDLPRAVYLLGHGTSVYGVSSTAVTFRNLLRQARSEGYREIILTRIINNKHIFMYIALVSRLSEPLPKAYPGPAHRAPPPPLPALHFWEVVFVNYICITCIYFN